MPVFRPSLLVLILTLPLTIRSTAIFTPAGRIVQRGTMAPQHAAFGSAALGIQTCIRPNSNPKIR
jgi:hypothetical protein